MEILNDERDEPSVLRVKAIVAQDLLSRAGYGPVKQIDIRQATVNAHFSSEDIEKLKQRAIIAAKPKSIEPAN